MQSLPRENSFRGDYMVGSRPRSFRAQGVIRSPTTLFNPQLEKKQLFFSAGTFNFQPEDKAIVMENHMNMRQT